MTEKHCEECGCILTYTVKGLCYNCLALQPVREYSREDEIETETEIGEEK